MWLRANSQLQEFVIATFVVDEDGNLRLADRHSEHFACAGGRPVLSAGEITFRVRPGRISVEAVSNQSTGYCPEADSWPTVEHALITIGLDPPPGFYQEFVFRRCVGCGQINVVKDGVLECAVCGAGLPLTWNFGGPERGSPVE